ncbi:MAG: protein kinase, partial [Deltaproteobacteria bacterium]|nr:protein kinase [Deltaproteobacteria bacterium]
MDHSGAAGGGLLAGRYRLLDRAAAGGMGEIWRAEDTATRQRVAIKRLPPAHGERDAREVSARMLREARALVALRHPHVVEVIDAGEEPPGEPFIVLEWLEGEDLGARMRRGGMKIEDALSIAGQVCEALTAVHQAGLIHRDVKPANIFLGKADSQSTPFVKLIDFGTARHPDATRITDVGEVVGTIMYMAPEQARGETVVDARADVYALGIVLYRMITGTVPFRGSDPLAVMMKVFTEEVPSPRISKPDIDPALERVVLRATARSRSERFASAEELRQALLELDALGAATDMTQNAPIPEGVVRDIAPPVAIAERRVVTLLAAWLQASDDDLAMDAAIGVLGSFGAAATRVKGHQLLGTFGGIASGGDEPRRAVDAAFAMIERLGDHVGRIAVATRREDVLADGCAPPGALARIRVPESAGDARVVVDRETARVLRGALKGRSLSDGSVAAESLAEAGAGRHAGPLVARAAELAALSKAVAQAAQSEASIVLVVGPAGVGKTRLVRALLADQQTKPGLLIEGRGDSVRRSFPFRAIARALQRVAGIQPGQSDDERQLRLRAVIARALDLPADTTDVVGVAEVLGEAIGVRFPESPRLELARSDPEVMQRMVLASFAQVFRGAGRV